MASQHQHLATITDLTIWASATITIWALTIITIWVLSHTTEYGIIIMTNI